MVASVDSKGRIELTKTCAADEFFLRRLVDAGRLRVVSAHCIGGNQPFAMVSVLIDIVPVVTDASASA
jgi:hypothetical protein